MLPPSSESTAELLACLCGLHFRHEDGGNISLRIVGTTGRHMPEDGSYTHIKLATHVERRKRRTKTSVVNTVLPVVLHWDET
jgi:hypothetical protein